MNPEEALRQIFLIISSTIILVATVEFIFYWFLYKFKSDYFWIVSLFIGAGLGWLFSPSSQNLSFSIIIGTAITGAIAVFSFYIIRGRYRLAIMMLAPAIVVISLVVIYPFFFEIRLAFANINLYTINKWLHGGALGWVGFKNFIRVFTESPIFTVTFLQLFMRTVLWTLINVIFHVTIGICVALLLNKHIKFKGIYRTIIIVPWAMPQVVAVLAWRGEFHPQFGVVNQLLEMIGIHGLNWWSDPVPVFLSCLIVNIWLGIPFMMIVFLGGLQAIPKSYYEAASIDGASSWQQFWGITLPLLRPVVVPSVTLGTIWTFNNINVIYLMTGQSGGNEYADILVSALYKSAFNYSRYSYSAAFAVVVFAILICITIAWIKISRGTESAIS